ncbi:Aste57867_10866 [Aphanomyces stellatus]|uniref:Aste57867_10866 protein n=1 Tax=Aphanomyces stellatus TaxID=120398 RepID=A0A485KRX0_9STRA|nr:hypothetical protein As57867_010826 [Aphanomyces stellatus]VFT87734.1 Aste57867_10866 [Aphanomyces stellatus]
MNVPSDTVSAFKAQDMAKKRVLAAVEDSAAEVDHAREDTTPRTKTNEAQDNSESGGEDGDESVCISVELSDFADFPIFDKHETMEIENLESEQPILRIGEFTLYGSYEDALGTDVYYEMPPPTGDATPSGPCKFVGTATKRLKFVIDPNEKRQFLRKPTKI